MTQALEARPRCEARHAQILSAAEACFREHGFHAASMAAIASAGQLSVGQIYRHFSGKEEIIAAIVRQDLEAFDREMQALASRSEGRIDRVLDGLQALIYDCGRNRRALKLEVRAEAARNAKIAAMMDRADEEITRQLRTLLSSTPLKGLTPGELDRRVEMVRIIIEGALARLTDRSEVGGLELGDTIRRVLALPLAPEPKQETRL